MLANVEMAFRALISALQIAKLYSTSHAKFLKALDAAFAAFQEAFRDSDEIVIGIVGEELAYKNDILFDLSRILKPMIVYLKSRGVERVSFSCRMQKEELKKLVDYLMLAKEEARKDPHEYLTKAGVRAISVGKLKVASDGDAALAKAQQAIDFLNLYNGTLDNVSSSIDKMLDNEDIDSLNLRFGVSQVMESLAVRSQEFLKLTTIKRYDMTTFTHILNVSILAMYVSAQLGFSKEDVLDIGTAALFHDIGKIAISRKLIRKTGKLTDDEFAIIKSHTVFGAEILLRYVSSLGPLPLVVCFEHHLKFDLSGYPRMPATHKPHIASLIVAICDVYDALSARRSYKASFAPLKIHEIMMQEKNKGFEPGLLDNFFRIMGVWPIGTVVALTDRRIAVVRDENPDDIFAPKVEVIAPEPAHEMIDLKEARPPLRIDRFLDPSEEGKPYLSLL
ncbi:MAG TPA: HD domain-containing protein [Candidatus Omnitrophota bacterium]|nr:HD domain-containing protein [Candidatus Omnitrophota bacterium]HRZ14541.1 HD domain-containing protein [Candidatus Omnitrophota bacterium]